MFAVRGGCRRRVNGNALRRHNAAPGLRPAAGVRRSSSQDSTYQTQLGALLNAKDGITVFPTATGEVDQAAVCNTIDLYGVAVIPSA